ncbi:MAG TPA: hypothetical protein VMV73_00815, partial [Candidatus Dormibacteraeota bacterium]|nr:hypothetical protein [Candidatus Dormibacteraeota bacterium]
MSTSPSFRPNRAIALLLASLAVIVVVSLALARWHARQESARLDALPGAQTLATGLSDIETHYYEPISARKLLLGAEQAALIYLKKHGLAHLPTISVVPSSNARLDGEHLADALDTIFRANATHLNKSGERALIDAALTGMLAAPHDPYTVYLPPKQWEQLTESLSGGDFGGIGVYIFNLRNGGVLLQPIPGLAAAKAGLKYPAILSSVDGRSVKNVATDIVQRWIRGPKGSVVRLVVAPFNTPKQDRSITIVRSIVRVPTVYSERIDGFGYIRLTEFGT